MKKMICYMMSMTLVAMVLFSGCGSADSETTETMAEANAAVEEEEESEVRGAFTESEMMAADSETETEAELETETEIETETETETEQETEAVLETEEETEETDDDVKAIEATAENFDYVALGNSITCNEVSDLWWGNWGMAASSEDKDYVHIVSQWLGGQSVKPVTTTVLDLKKWELAQQRDEIRLDYENYFNEYTDLITIQTGENITEFKETLGSDYQNLVAMLKEKAPNAQILMLGEALWPSEDIEAAKRSACEQYGVTFVEMGEFLNGYESVYKSYVGALVSGLDGGTYTIANEVVAAHPNDDGMACIAQQVINHITIQN